MPEFSLPPNAPVGLTPYALAKRFVGLRELPVKGQDHPFIQWCFTVCGYGTNTPDEQPWCSAFANGICWLLGLPHSQSAAARSWLAVGRPVNLTVAALGFDVVVLKRAGDNAGPEVRYKDGWPPGHVGFFAGIENGGVLVLGGNQGDQVSIARFSLERILGIRRLVAA